VQITIESDRGAICAGGWDETRHAYEYLKKEYVQNQTGQWVEHNEWVTRSQTPDPHIATLTATVKDLQGVALPGKSVTITWDMPGPAPVETRTVTTDDMGKASVDVVSGDEVSKDYDEESGELLFDTPVPFKAVCDNAEKEIAMDVLAPTTEWQYKDEAGNYVPWDGEIYGLYPNTFQKKDIPLRAVVTFNNQPVTGHKISWEINKILDKGGEEISSSDSEYPTYGTMSGAVSTTTAQGGATATFTLGYNFGQIEFGITDGSVYTSH
jgi:hypothetical protein